EAGSSGIDTRDGRVRRFAGPHVDGRRLADRHRYRTQCRRRDLRGAVGIQRSFGARQRRGRAGVLTRRAALGRTFRTFVLSWPLAVAASTAAAPEVEASGVDASTSPVR